MLFLSKSLIFNWHGDQSAENEAEFNDYQRACAVVDEIDTISVGHAEAVVLGDEPDRTALIHLSSALFILRWRWAESEESLLSLLLPKMGSLSFAKSGSFSTVPGEHVLFDAALSGAEIEQQLSVDLDANVNLLETVFFEPNLDTCAIIHRITPA